MLRPLMVFILLGACALPRGAPIEREVLAEVNSEFPNLSLYSVTRDTVPALATWPATDNVRRFSWINHTAASGDIRIQPFDRIDLTIWDSEENSLLTSPTSKLTEVTNLRVTERGQVFVPYIGYVDVANRTPDAARRVIEQEMTAIVPSAQVQLSVSPGTRGSVSLVGGVRSPGTVPLPEGHFTVLNLISQGGGPDQLRNPQVRLIRAGKTYGTSLERLYENGNADTILKGGDKVALVDDDRFFRALGATGTEEAVYFSEDKISALDALSLMAGIDDRRANPQGVLILRQYPSSAVRSDSTGPRNARTVFAIDMTTADGLFSAGKFPIYSGDTVLVTESPVNAASTVFGILGTLIGYNNQLR
ncbi:polysaccharide export outer membrane protein [Aliiruegeria haliotis]|uniref:Polysaccharide export outer membrane protein n=1 Tax=Aliiruegeria haliotis TaxID=1280846 RepID=A0A2T0RPH3_9RHOB|nr:polysaccharide biosynthesis/export family protein [Aliiruegeria haliotis]PRY23010.1 polysaccharide export outer membrane protein [Aliiruegeria haliotis]